MFARDRRGGGRYGKRGVPSSISIDGSLMVADDELGHTITRFTPLE